MARANSYDGYIFDYGGVLAHHQTDEDQARLAGIAAIPQERFSSLYWDTRLDYDKGSVTAAEYWQNIGRGANKTLPRPLLSSKSWTPTIEAGCNSTRRCGIGSVSCAPPENAWPCCPTCRATWARRLASQTDRLRAVRPRYCFL